MINDLTEYLAAVTSRLGIGLESCCWGAEAPQWAYVALDWRMAGQDVALLWDSRSGWSMAIEPEIGCEMDVVARLDGETTPPPVAVARFVEALRAEMPVLPAAAGQGELVQGEPVQGESVLA